jgi:hypothetical protein
LWALGFPEVVSVEGILERSGAVWADDGSTVEDLALATQFLDGDTGLMRPRVSLTRADPL